MNPLEELQSKNPIADFTQNITERAKEGTMDPVIGRDTEVRRVMQILTRRTKNNPALIGDPGVGKTAIVEGLAQRIVSGDVPASLEHKEILSLDMASLLAGAGIRGMFEERLKKLVEDIEKAGDKYILFIDEMHTIVGAGGGEGAVDASNILKPALARGKLRTIGATTLREYRQYVEKDPALERRFQPVYVQEPSKEDTLSILRGIKEKYEVHHGVQILDNALTAAVDLSTRYIPDRFLPDKAIDLLDEAASSANIALSSLPSHMDTINRRLTQISIELAALKKESGVEDRVQKLKKEKDTLEAEYKVLEKRFTNEKDLVKKQQTERTTIESLRSELERMERDGNLERAAEIKYGLIPEHTKQLEQLDDELKQIPDSDRLLSDTITEEDIAKVVATATGIPATSLMQSESAKLMNLEETLKKVIVGQDEALHVIAATVKRGRALLTNANRPQGSFLFLGPTGVGKTETVKALAKELFNDERAMIRIDMSEYSEAHSVARLIGSPPGYIGYEEGGQLTEAVRRKPYSIVLFDEVEKANPQIYNSLLQVLDDGRLTDGKGRTVNFTNTIIIFTSNLGSGALEGLKDETKRELIIMEEVRKFFKPEFINRLDNIVIFNNLTPDMMHHIVDRQLHDVARNLMGEKITLHFTDAVRDYLAEAGYDPVYGARPLRRLVESTIVDLLADQIIEGKVAKNSTITIDRKNKHMVVQHTN